MIRRIIGIGLILTLLFGFSGCASLNVHNFGAKAIHCGIEPEDYEAINPDEDFKQAIADFSIELFKNSTTMSGNALISPLSVMLALAMTANGAEDVTLAEFEQLLGDKLSLDLINKYYATYADSLVNTEDAKLSIANSIWVRDTEELTVKDEFLHKNETYYQAQVYKAAFDSETVKDINYWVEDNTDGMIDGIVNEMPSHTLLMLINAIAFDAKWQDVYMENQVRDVEFTTYEGEVQNVSGMHCDEYAYIEDENTTGFIKDYREGYKFVALLPDEGVDFFEYIEYFTGEKYLNLVNNVQETQVETMLPKFSYEYELSLNTPLKNMGLVDAFDSDNADFKSMCDYPENVYIENVIHKTYIEVAEEGTRAAAVTAVMMNDASGMPPEELKEVYLDRPFVYAIVDEETMLPIFMGTVTTIK